MRRLLAWSMVLALAALCCSLPGCGQHGVRVVQGTSIGEGSSSSSSRRSISGGSSSGSKSEEQPTSSQVASYSQLLQRLHRYQTELPPSLLSQAIGLQGNTWRLQRSLKKMIRGEPVKVALMGGSISMRGWNHMDEAYMSQVHKWLELALVEGCREEALRTATEQEEHDGNETERRLFDSQPMAARHARGLRVSDPFPHDPHPSSDPDNDLHIRTHAGYLASHHMCGGSKIELYNLAVPAAGPGYAERCALQRLPQDVDLVFLDFGCNDYHDSRYFSHPERHAYERILRYVLSRPKSPAVVLFEAFSWAQSGGDFYGGGGQAGGPAAKRGSLGQDKHTLLAEYYGEVQVLSVRAALWQILNATSDEERLIYVPNGDPNMDSDFLHVSLFGHRWYADIIINYLRSQLTSMVAKLLASEALSSATHAPGAETGGQGGDEEGASDSVMTLLLGEEEGAAAGPLVPGSREEVGRKLQGDEAMWRHGDGVRRSAAATGAEQKERQQQQQQQQQGQGGAADGEGQSAQCHVQGSRGHAYPVPCSASLPGLPPPFFPGNEVHALGLCAVGEDLKDLAEAAVGAGAQQQGWEWVDEGKGANHKWGYVSTQVGAELSIAVPLDPSLLQTAQAAVTATMAPSRANAPTRPPPYMLAWLIYLESYTGMGSAAVTCRGSCHCSQFEINAHKKTRQSVPALKSFKIYPRPPGTSGSGGGGGSEGAPEAGGRGLSSESSNSNSNAAAASGSCLLHVRVLSSSSSPGQGHKFKVIGLTTSATSIWHIEEIFKTGQDPTVG